ncbi:MAG: Ras-related protein Rab-10 [Amphiamblys sp. WSBS2006]|nr:MAG: Ras-related protein Rab-10 [Amphiamblys sp. WSBS2006]
MRTLKLLIIGDSGVGKSSILLRFCEDEFAPSFISTIGIDFKMCDLRVGESEVRLQIWDTAGQERFRTITTSYYRGAMGIVLVYDTTNEKSFANINNWLSNVEVYCSEDVPMVLVGNKVDEDKKRRVQHGEGEELAQKIGVDFFETSAKTNTNIDELFAALSKKVLEKNPLRKDEPPKSCCTEETEKNTKWCC